MAMKNGPVEVKELPNGAGVAALLAAAIGCAVLGVFALAGDASAAVNAFFNFYKPAGALSGVTTCAIIIWLVAWFGLDRLWRGRDVAVVPMSVASFVLLLVGFALTFPPFMDLLQGK